MTLNPVLRIDTQMIEAITAHHRISRSAARERAREALARVGIPSPEERLARLSAPVLGRHAPARRDRHRAAQQARPDHLRRADHRARRHDPGADPVRDAEAVPRVRHGADLDHPRPVGGGRARRYRQRDVRRPDRRGRAGRRRAGVAAPSLHGRPDRVDAGCRHPAGACQRQAARADPRHDAVAAEAAGRLRLQGALQPRHRHLQDRAAVAAGRARAGRLRCFHPVTAARPATEGA